MRGATARDATRDRMSLTYEEREILDNADPDAVKQAIIEVLRENDGSKFRALLRVLRDSSDPGAKEPLCR
jgi:hypothetical protein